MSISLSFDLINSTQYVPDATPSLCVPQGLIQGVIQEQLPLSMQEIERKPITNYPGKYPISARRRSHILAAERSFQGTYPISSRRRVHILSEKQVIENPDYRHQVPIISSEINTLLKTLNKDLEKEASQFFEEEAQELDTAIERTKRGGGLFPGLRLKTLSEELGKGVFLDPYAKPLKKGTILGIYSGEYVIRQLENVKKGDLNYAFVITKVIGLEKGEHVAVFGCDTSFIDDGDYAVYVDGKNKGNWTRFINHGGTRANCAAELCPYSHLKDGEMRTDYVIVISVDRRINPGEQLLLDYSSEYWDGESFTSSLTPQTYTVPCYFEEENSSTSQSPQTNIQAYNSDDESSFSSTSITSET